MKNILLIAAFLSSSSVFAQSVQWSDLQIGSNYKLTNDIVFETGATFKAGEKFDMTDFIIGGVPVIYYQMMASNCKNPTQTAPMILAEVNEVVMGVELSEGCTLDIFIEPQDFYRDSAFAE